MSLTSSIGGMSTSPTEEPDAADKSLSSEVKNERSTTEERLAAWGEYVACCEKVERLWDHGSRATQDEHRIQALAKDLEETQRRNELLERELIAQKAEHAPLIEDMVRICEEKQRLFEECEAGKLEKELADWIQQQYREKETELRATVGRKDEDIRQLQDQLDNANAESSQLTYYEKNLAVGEEVIADLRKRLEAAEQELDRQRNSNAFLQRERNEVTQRYILLKSHFGALQENIAMLDASTGELTGRESERHRGSRRRRNRRRGSAQA